MNTNEIITECATLSRAWYQRNQKFRDWWELVTMVDNLKEQGLESFISNEPRTFYNLSLQLLTPDNIIHRIPTVDLAEENLKDANKLSNFLNKTWRTIEYKNLRSGKLPWIDELVSFLLLTGWYSIFSMATPDGIIAEVYNPADVYPEFDDEGLVQCARIYTLSAKAAQRKCFSKGWKLESPPIGDVKVYNYWTITDQGVANAVVIGNQLVKPLTVEPTLTKIPIYCAPVAGLPDRGSISQSTSWQTTIGQSLVSTNESVYNNFNKQITFMQQLMRDTAQPRWVEKSRTGHILNPEDVFKRGAIFSMTPDEDVSILPTNPIPIELRALIMDIQGMLQRGSLPYALYGNIQQQISGYLMSQIAQSAIHTLKPYYRAIKFLLEELDNNWLSDMYAYSIKVDKFSPSQALKDYEVEVDYRIQIPGDIIQRANTARILNPSFQLSTQTVTSTLFPEIANPMEEQARVASDKAYSHPVRVQLAMIEALKRAASIFREDGNESAAKLYENVASSIESQFTGKQQAAQPPYTPRQEILPREATSLPPEALGEIPY